MKREEEVQGSEEAGGKDSRGQNFTLPVELSLAALWAHLQKPRGEGRKVGNQAKGRVRAQCSCEAAVCQLSGQAQSRLQERAPGSCQAGRGCPRQLPGVGLCRRAAHLRPEAVG